MSESVSTDVDNTCQDRRPDVPITFRTVTRKDSGCLYTTTDQAQNVYDRPKTVHELRDCCHNATRTVFPGITVKGCIFHYTQAYGENLAHWSTSHQQKQRHSTTCEKSSCYHSYRWI